jgi:hypothetical protein
MIVLLLVVGCAIRSPDAAVRSTAQSGTASPDFATPARSLHPGYDVLKMQTAGA